MFLSTSSRETLRFEGNKIHSSPRDQSLSVYCYSNLGAIYAKVYVGWEIKPDVVLKGTDIETFNTKHPDLPDNVVIGDMFLIVLNFRGFLNSRFSRF